MGASAWRVNQQPQHQQPLEQRKPLRLWPGVAAVALQWLVMFGLPVFFPEQGGTAFLAGVAGALVVLLWWIFFSRAPWLERIAAVAIMMGAVAVTSRLVHESIANGMMGFMLYVYAAPVLTLALVAWAVASRRSFHTCTTRLIGRRAPPWMWSADARPHRRHYRRCHCRFRMAMDADSGTTVARAHD